MKASREFLDAFCTAGTLVQTCDFCGVTYFVSEGDYSEGELEGYRAQAEKEPKQYVEITTDDYVSCGELDGRTLVFQCGCEKIARYERFILNHIREIADFLKKKTGADFEQAKRAVELSNDISFAAIEAPQLVAAVTKAMRGTA